MEDSKGEGWVTAALVVMVILAGGGGLWYFLRTEPATRTGAPPSNPALTERSAKGDPLPPPGVEPRR